MVQVTVQNTLGAVQLGTTLAVFLFGVVTLQYHHYLQLYEDDRRVFKLLAYIVWFLELLHTICIVGETYRGTIVFYGDFLAYQRYPFMGAAIMLGGLITMLIHLFFSLRIWKALPKPFRYIGGLTGLAATVRGAGSVYLGIRVILAKTLQEYREANGWLIRTLLVSGAIIDVVIAVSMLWFLISKRERDLHRAIRLVDHLAAFTIRTGLLTSLAALSVLITFQVMPETFVWIGIYVALAKLYSNSLFSALNGRQRLRSFMAESSFEITSETVRPRAHRSQIVNSRDLHRAKPAISIEMTSPKGLSIEKGSPLEVPSPSDTENIIPGTAM